MNTAIWAAYFHLLSTSGAPTPCGKCAAHTSARIVKGPKITGEEEIFVRKLLLIKLIVLTFSVLSILFKNFH